MTRLHSLPVLQDPVCDDLQLETDCIVTAIRRNKDEVTITVALTGTVTIPEYAARELLKTHHTYSIADMVLDLFLPRWTAPVKMTVSRRVKDALTGVMTAFDNVMTNTLR
jgi:hypothetical protein